MVSGNFKGPTDTVRRLRTVLLLASSALCLTSAWPAAAQNFALGSGDFNTAAKWTPGTVPTGTALFGLSGAALSFSVDTTVGGWTFNTLSSAYSFTNGQLLSFTDAGISNGLAASINNSGAASFTNTSTADRTSARASEISHSDSGARPLLNTRSRGGTHRRLIST